MSTMPVHRDERTVAVENASYRWGYFILTYGALALVMYRSFARNDASWDLMALVILGGAVPTAYQAANRILTRQWAAAAGAGMVIAAIVAIVTVWLRR